MQQSPIPKRSFGILPAGGESRRMGTPKLRLIWQGLPLLLHAVRAMRAGGVRHLCVVLHPDLADMAPGCQSQGAIPLVLAQPTADMKQSILAGVNLLSQPVFATGQRSAAACPVRFATAFHLLNPSSLRPTRNPEQNVARRTSLPHPHSHAGRKEGASDPASLACYVADCPARARRRGARPVRSLSNVNHSVRLTRGRP